MINNLPIKNIEKSIEPQTSHIVWCNIFDFFNFHNHMQLRVDRQCLQPNGIAPANFKSRIAIVDK